jgi:hypothetical protein
MALLSAALLSLSGCQSGNASGASMGPEPEATTLPPIKVDLPTPPSFAASDIPEKFPDGAYTISGLRRNKRKFCTPVAAGAPVDAQCLLGKQVKLRAYLLEVYQCPVCPKGQTCKLCDQPHFYMGDKADTKKEKAMMIADYLAPKQKPPILTVGKQYDIDGSFSINTPGGFGDSEGLISFDKMKDDKGTEFLSPTQQLQQKAEAGEAYEAALAAKKNKKK